MNAAAADALTLNFGSAKKNADGTYTCIEGNTSTGNNCNGGMVMRRKRYQSQINWIVRPKYDSDVKKPSGKYSGVIPTATIRKGDSGTNVKHLQEFLNWYGVRKGDCNGVFGATTEAAQKKYQKAEGIKQTGVFGKTSQEHAEKYKSNGKYTGEWPDWVSLSGDIIAQTAKELAWPLGTKPSRYKYPKGKPTDKFYKALCKVYPEHASWKPVSTRKGASCDVGAGTVLRYSKAFPSISRALAKQFPQMEKSAKFKDVGIKKSSQMRAGDIGMYMNKGRGSHIWVALGGKLIAESNFTAKYYFHLVKKNINKTSRHKKYHCFRMVKPIRNYMKYGDEGSEILKWQKFLKWYGYDIKCDGVFGDSTLTFSRKFQKAQGLAGSGDVGTKTLQKAKAVKK